MRIPLDLIKIGRFGKISFLKNIFLENLIFFLIRFASLEQEGFEDIQNYFKPSRQDLWIPKKPPKEIIRGVWNENYLKIAKTDTSQ